MVPVYVYSYTIKMYIANYVVYASNINITKCFYIVLSYHVYTGIESYDMVLLVDISPSTRVWLLQRDLASTRSPLSTAYQ